MTLIRSLVRGLVAVLMLVAGFGIAHAAEDADMIMPGLKPGAIPMDHLFMPETPESGVVFLLSDESGWSKREERVAGRLSSQGAIVVGIDLKRYYDTLSRVPGECLYMVADIERLSGQLHRLAKIERYTQPVIGGVGAGATLALAIAAQTPPATIGATIAVDPGDTVPLSRVLCTPAPKRPVAGGVIYGLSPGELPNSLRILFSPDGKDAGRAHAQALQEAHAEVEIDDASGKPGAILFAEIQGARAALAENHDPLDLPIVEVPAEARYGAMAIIYSGDGGWRDIDRQLAGYLQADGIPVVGVDALRYFWHEREPAEVASDLSRIMARYRERFGTRNVILVGYSFGANILPATYRLLPDADRNRVMMMSLLALSHQADFQIAVSGWLGFAGAGKHGDPAVHLQGIEPRKVQCVYGLLEDDSACPALQPMVAKGLELVARPGGHHFDGDYKALSDLIVRRAASALIAD